MQTGVDPAILAPTNIPKPMSAGSRSTIQVFILNHDESTGLRESLLRHGYNVSVANSSLTQERIWQSATPDVVILNSPRSENELHALASALKMTAPFAALVVLSNAVNFIAETLKITAAQPLPSSSDASIVINAIERSFHIQQLRRKQRAEDIRIGRIHTFPFAGQSEAMKILAECSEQAAASDCPISIQGERGTGKGSLARWIHQRSRRAHSAFLELNAIELRGLESPIPAAISSGLRKQTFADILQTAQHGTIFINELEKANLQGQTMLLQILSGKQVRNAVNFSIPVGDLRLIASTATSVARLVHSARFRSDLGCRFSQCVLRIPPLRERINDLPALAGQILCNLAGELAKHDLDLTRGAVRLLQSYSWPGNTRELKCVLERAVLLSGSTLITEKHLIVDSQAQRPYSNDRYLHLRDVERHYIEQVLERERGCVQSAAKVLGIPRSSLYRKLKRFQSERVVMRTAS